MSRAGGFGVLGAVAYNAEQLEEELTWIDEHVDGKPYGVDVVMPASYEGAGNLDPERMEEQLAAMIPEKSCARQFLCARDQPALGLMAL